MSKLVNIAVDKLINSMTFEEFIEKINKGLMFVLCGVICAVIYYYAKLYIL